MTQIVPKIGRLVVIMIVVAMITFGFLSLALSQTQQPDTRSGVINPDASMQQIIDTISQGNPVLTGKQVTGVSNDIDLEQMMQDLLIDADDTNHNAPSINYNERVSTLCKRYASVCDITDLKGTYTPRQSFAYQLMLTYMVTTLKRFGHDPLTSLENVTIDNFPNTRRGYANAKLMVINTHQIGSYKEFLQILAHELGHVIDLGAISGTSSQINTTYTEFGKAKFAVDDPSIQFYSISRSNENTLRAGMGSIDFVSGYAISNPFEDFAETHNMYLYHREIFAYLASSSSTLQRKYDYFNSIFQSQFLSNNFNPTDLRSIDTQFRPWDTTRM